MYNVCDYQDNVKTVVISSKNRDRSRYPGTHQIDYQLSEALDNVTAMQITHVSLSPLNTITITHDNNYLYFSIQALADPTDATFFMLRLDLGVFTFAELATAVNIKLQNQRAIGIDLETSNTPPAIKTATVQSVIVDFGVAQKTDALESFNQGVPGFFVSCNSTDKQLRVHTSQAVFHVSSFDPTQSNDFVVFNTNVPHGMLPGAMVDLRLLTQYMTAPTRGVGQQNAIVYTVPSATSFTVFGTVANNTSLVITRPTDTEGIAVIQRSRVSNVLRDYGHDKSGTTFAVQGITQQNTTVMTIAHDDVFMPRDSNMYVHFLPAPPSTDITQGIVCKNTVQPFTHTIVDPGGSITMNAASTVFNDTLRMYLTYGAGTTTPNNYIQLSPASVSTPATGNNNNYYYGSHTDNVYFEVSVRSSSGHSSGIQLETDPSRNTLVPSSTNTRAALLGIRSNNDNAIPKVVGPYLQVSNKGIHIPKITVTMYGDSGEPLPPQLIDYTMSINFKCSTY